jgi:NADH pyrophosphatase NudC (nudix superfamily)
MSLPEVTDVPVQKLGMWYCSVSTCDFHAHAKEAVVNHVNEKHHYCGNCGEHDPKRLKWLKEPCTHRTRITMPEGYCAFWKPKKIKVTT